MHVVFPESSPLGMHRMPFGHSLGKQQIFGVFGYGCSLHSSPVQQDFWEQSLPKCLRQSWGNVVVVVWFGVVVVVVLQLFSGDDVQLHCLLFLHSHHGIFVPSGHMYSFFEGGLHVELVHWPFMHVVFPEGSPLGMHRMPFGHSLGKQQIFGVFGYGCSLHSSPVQQAFWEQSFPKCLRQSWGNVVVVVGFSVQSGQFAWS